MSGKVPTSKQRFTNQTEKNNLKVFKTKTGILLCPADFFMSIESIKFSISPGTVRARKKEELGESMNGFPFSFFLFK